jgi:hypothetical protein
MSDIESAAAEMVEPAGAPVLPGPAYARHVWLLLEASEVIELKQVVLDRDALGAVEFFQRVIAPRVRAAAQQRGLDVDWEGVGSGDEHLPG